MDFSPSCTFSKYLTALFDTFDSTINNMHSKKDYLLNLQILCFLKYKNAAKYYFISYWNMLFKFFLGLAI